MLSQLSKGLDTIPKALTELFEAPFDAQKGLALASDLGKSTTSYQDQILGGRLLIYIRTRACKKTVDYIKAYAHKLNPLTYFFMEQHAEELDIAMSRNFNREFTQHDFFSARCLTHQYLLRTSFDEEPLESIQMMYMRQAVQFYGHRTLARVLRAYNELSDQYFTQASPTIFNAGTRINQEASCFLLKVGDSMDEISGAVPVLSAISKLNGGAGVCVSSLRHSQIGDVGTSEGPNGFLAIYDKTIGKVNQGGKRNGAGTSFLRSCHIDFPEFVKLTDNFANSSERLTDLNTCAWMDDHFFTRVQNAIKADHRKKKGLLEDPTLKTEWTMFCPKKANSLNGKYGIDFVREYQRMEVLAKEREIAYQEAVKQVGLLHNEMLSHPDDDAIRIRYLETCRRKAQASKDRIDHKVINAYQLYRSIINIQTNSGMPYIMHADACNYKSNQKSDGPIEQSNLCLEILEHTSEATKGQLPKIAACNLGSMNLARYVVGIFDWQKHNLYPTPESCVSDLCRCYDFFAFGAAVRSLVENMNEVIDHNYYPLDERDEKGQVTKRGPISTLNFQTRPLGIGESGQSDALAMMDCTYEGNPSIMFNKMVYACQYWHAMLASIALAIRDGPYENFLKGQHRRFVGTSHPAADNDGFITEKGSPLSNGQFQYDLWREEADMLRHFNLLHEVIYNSEDDIPVDPVQWGQTILYIYVIPLGQREELDSKDNSLLDFTITPTRRACGPYEKEYVVEPTWDCLRRLVVKYGARNSLLIALMPTASSANTLRNCESTEAHQGCLYNRELKAGSYVILVRHLCEDLSRLGLWSANLANFIAACDGSAQMIDHYIADHPEEFDASAFDDTILKPTINARLRFIMEKYKTMYEISQKKCLKMARQRGIHVCQSQSTNLYFKDCTEGKMESATAFSQKLRLKTGRYYTRQSPAKSIGSFTLPAELLEYKRRLDSRSGNAQYHVPSTPSDTSVVSPSRELSLSEDTVVITGSLGVSSLKVGKSGCSLANREACMECTA